MQRAVSSRATRALTLVEHLQARFVANLEAVSAQTRHPVRFQTASWLRDRGSHGGGNRRGVFEETPVFNRASVNISQVHYDDQPDKRLASATALSTIIHPSHPWAPSVHAHISYTEMRDGRGYWRLMADLNPALERSADTKRFRDQMRAALGEQADHAEAQGARYFHIPALGRHRGVAHFYLEQYDSGGFETDVAFAERFGTELTNVYPQILGEALAEVGAPTDQDRGAQLGYHTVYFFQVLTLDRGTTSGLLVHDQNDVGILGSLPARVDTDLLRSWQASMPKPQDALLERLLEALGATGVVEVSEARKLALAQASRAHYQAHPEALELQARGDAIPPTVHNHGTREH